MSITTQLTALPSIAITETERVLKIALNVSDWHVDDMTVKVNEGTTLFIDMKSEYDQGQSYYLGEMQPETIRRIIPLGFEVSEKAINTNCDNGVLEIRIPKPAVKETTASKETATVA